MPCEVFSAMYAWTKANMPRTSAMPRISSVAVASSVSALAASSFLNFAQIRPQIIYDQRNEKADEDSIFRDDNGVNDESCLKSTFDACFCRQSHFQGFLCSKQ